MSDAILVVLRIGDGKIGKGFTLESAGDSRFAGNSQRLTSTCQLIISRLDDIQRTPLISRFAQVDHLSKIAASLLSVPFAVPPYYFQAKTCLDIKLSTRPNGKDGVIKTTRGTQLVIKLEGVIQCNSGAEAERMSLLSRIKAVGIAMEVQSDDTTDKKARNDWISTMNMDLTNSVDERLGQPIGWHVFAPPPPVTRVRPTTWKLGTNDTKGSGHVTHQQVRVQDGYFTATFMMESKPHSYNATFTVSLVEKMDNVWCTGPGISLSVTPPV